MKQINIAVTNDFKSALERFCKDREISISSFIKSLVAEILIDNKYLEEREK